MLFVIGVLFLIIEVVALDRRPRAGASRSPDRCTSCSPAPSASGRATSRTRSPCSTRRSARRAGAVVQLDDRQHRGSAARRRPRRSGSRRSCASRTRSRCRCCRRGRCVMPGLSVTALCVPAREVGGDYYDFLPLDDQRRRRADCRRLRQGHVGGALHGGAEGADAVAQPRSTPRRATLLIAANRIIADHLDARSFITMTYAVVDLRARTMTYARAGHTPLIYVPGAGADGGRARSQILAPDGMVLGLKLDNGEMFERLLEEETIPLHAGRSLPVVHRRHQRGDERRATTASARRGSAGWSRSTPTCRRTSCASACCARSRRSSATRRSTTT